MPRNLGFRSFVRNTQRFILQRLSPNASSLVTSNDATEQGQTRTGRPECRESESQRAAQEIPTTPVASASNAIPEYSSQQYVTGPDFSEAKNPYLPLDFVNLPHNVREDANFMTLIGDACSVHTQRSVCRSSIAARLRLLEMGEGQDGPEDLQAVREELRKADEALHETLVMMDALKAFIAESSRTASSSFKFGGRARQFGEDSESLLLRR